MTKPSILIVDDDKIILDSLCEFMTLEGYTAIGAGTFTEAVTDLKRQVFSLVITDVNMPDGDGFELLSLIKKNYPQAVAIVITGYGTIESAVEAIKMGAYDYLTKPIVDDDLRLAVERAIRQQSLLSENRDLRCRLEDKYSLEKCAEQILEYLKQSDVISRVGKETTPGG